MHLPSVLKSRWIKTSEALRWPSQCAVCHSWPAEPVCQPCVARFSLPQRRCVLCALALPMALADTASADVCVDCARHPPPLNATLAAVNYDYPWSLLIHRYKFAGHDAWARFFAQLLLDAPGVRCAIENLQADDWLLPLPLSAQRLQTRGFNQAWALTQALVQHGHTQARSDAQLLLRVRHGPPQRELTRSARLANVQGAFQVDPLRLGLLQGRRVVLVDDVMTSGASLFAAANALQNAGVAHITGLVLARTPAPE